MSHTHGFGEGHSAHVPTFIFIFVFLYIIDVIVRESTTIIITAHTDLNKLLIFIFSNRISACKKITLDTFTTT